MWKSCAFAAGVFGLIAVNANAAVLEYSFTAQITEVATTGDVSALPNIGQDVIANTTSITGSFAYDSTASETASSATTAVYPINSILINLPSSQFGFGPIISGSGITSDATVSVTNNSSDFFTINGETNPDPIPEGEDYTELSTTIGFVDDSGLVLSDTSLPSNLSLADFNGLFFTLTAARLNRTVSNGFAFTNFIGDIQLVGTITDLELTSEGPSPVPVPAALPLLATALAGLGLLRLKRSKAA